MDEEVLAERRKKRREYMRNFYRNNPDAREKARIREAQRKKKMKEDGTYEAFLEARRKRERGAFLADPEYHRMRVRERSKRWAGKHWEKVMLRNARSRALKKGLPFNIRLEDFVVPDICPVLGIPLEKNVKHMRDNSPSVDRIRPELGYVKGNVRVISQRANRLKCDATAAELKLVYEDLLRLEAT